MYDENNLSDALREKYTDENGNFDRERLNSDLQQGEKFVFRIHLFLSMIFIIAGLAFFFIGCFELYNSFKDKKLCTVYTEGVVSDFKSTQSDMNDENSSLVYAPVFTYNSEGQEYTYSGNSYSDKGNLFVGKKVTVYVDPDDVGHVYIPDYKVKKRNNILFIIIGLALSGGFIGYCFYKKREFTRDFNRLTNNNENN